MASDQDKMRALEDKLLETDPSDVATIELLKAEHAHLQSRAKAAVPTPRPAAAAANSPTASGKGGGERIAEGLAIAATAPAKGVGGIADLGMLLGSKGRNVFDKIIGDSPSFPDDQPPPYLTPQIDNLADALAGRKIPQSVARSAFEGAIMAPLSGAKTAGNLAQAALAGGTSGGVSQAIMERGGNPLVAAGAGMLAGGVVSVAPQLRGLSRAEALAEGRIKHALAGVPEERLTQSIPAHAEGRQVGTQLLPSQALDVDAPGLQNLQGALLASRAEKAGPFLDRVGKQADWAQDKLRGLKDAGGQAPRGDADLAIGLQKVSKEALKEGNKAVNAATKADYGALTAKAWKFGPELADSLYTHLRKQGIANRGNPAVLSALQESGEQVLGLLRRPGTTPQELQETLRFVKNNLPAYAAPGLKPADANFVRATIADIYKPLEAALYKHSPELARAQATQAALRSSLPGQFDDLVQQAKRAGGPGGAADAAMQRPEVLGAVQKADPQLLQELLSRTVRETVDKSLTPSASTGLIPRGAGTAAKVAMTTGSAGENLQKFLPALFKNAQNPQAAAEGFNRVLRVVDRASREPGSAFLRGTSMVEAGTRIAGGSYAQKISEGGRQLGGYLTRFQDNATIDVLNRPDVMERLLYISKLPEGKVTQSLVLSLLPQLFEEGPQK